MMSSRLSGNGGTMQSDVVDFGYAPPMQISSYVASTSFEPVTAGMMMPSSSSSSAGDVRLHHQLGSLYDSLDDSFGAAGFPFVHEQASPALFPLHQHQTTFGTSQQHHVTTMAPPMVLQAPMMPLMPDVVYPFGGGGFVKREDGDGGRIGLNLGRRTYFSPADVLAVDRLLMRSRVGGAMGMLGLGLGVAHQHQPPRCQAESCKADLSSAKHYHRRHKVCEYHAKASSVVAAGKQQRFCQQCSRFHVLGEFDEAKRSCRKRLTEHNRRRRKPAGGAQDGNGSSSPPPPPPQPPKKVNTGSHISDHMGVNGAGIRSPAISPRFGCNQQQQQEMDGGEVLRRQTSSNNAAAATALSLLAATGSPTSRDCRDGGGGLDTMLMQPRRRDDDNNSEHEQQQQEEEELMMMTSSLTAVPSTAAAHWLVGNSILSCSSASTTDQQQNSTSCCNNGGDGMQHFFEVDFM